MDHLRRAVIAVVLEQHPSATRTDLFRRFNDPASNLKRSKGGVGDAVRQVRMAETTESSTHG